MLLIIVCYLFVMDKFWNAQNLLCYLFFQLDFLFIFIWHKYDKKILFMSFQIAKIDAI